jgi:hypothetical protein
LSLALKAVSRFMTQAMDNNPPADDSIDFAEIARRVRRGFILVLALLLIGIAAGMIIGLADAYRQPAVTTQRVTFSFAGFERGTYPNGAKFQPDDLRAPDVINDALARLGMADPTGRLATQIRGALVISGVVSPALIKERDRLRVAGQPVPPLIPDEYEMSLTLPRDQAPGLRQRELLVTEIVSAYRRKFRRTFVDVPAEFGNAFAALSAADFIEYELVLTKELQNLVSFLENQSLVAQQFRSPTSGLSFQDLLKQANLFSQIKVNNVLGPIYMHGLSKDRDHALVKMDYFLRTLEDQEQRLREEEAVVANLLDQTRERSQNYVLASKQLNPQSAQPLVDQSLIDTLLANDAYNFLVRRALEAGLAVKRVQAQKNQWTERRQRMQSFIQTKDSGQAAAIEQMQAALRSLEGEYQKLLQEVQTCLTDFSTQEYSDAVRISMQAATPSHLRGGLVGALVGGMTGLFLGLGMSLLGAEPRTRKA